MRLLSIIFLSLLCTVAFAQKKKKKDSGDEDFPLKTKLVELELEGVLQIAAFHPNFQFAGTAADDIGNCTNRSPYPTLHLLREDSIEHAVQAIPEAQDIYEQNIRTLKALGITGWVALGVGPTETLPQDGTPRGAKS